MDEPMAPQPEARPQKALTNNGDKSKMHKVLNLVLALLLAASLGVNAWLYMANMQATADKAQLNKEKTDLQAMVDQLKNTADQAAAAPEDAAACNDTASASLKENIKAALDSKNTAVFATYTSNPVKFVIAASEKGGNESPDQAATDMNYTHTATGPWNFSLPAATLNNYDASFYTDYFDANTYVGKAASGMVASFDFDCSGKVKQIFIAADDDLLL